MRKYETVIISDPDLQDQTRTDLFDKIKQVIARQDGLLVQFDDWGSRKLAYEINKKLRGHYTCLTYGGTGDLVKELERNLGIFDDVMKFMTILVSNEVTPESLAEEAQAAEAARAASEAAQAAQNTADPETDDPPEEPAPAATAASETADAATDPHS
jgi:small subunit ribosomal protein S6